MLSACGFKGLERELRPTWRNAGSSIRPWRCSISIMPRHTMSRSAPLACTQFQASHILGRMARTLSADWQALYAHPIYFVETFIDPQRFRGTCYRAANWTLLGTTTGRGKDAPTHQANRSIKVVLGYALVKDFRQRLSKLDSTAALPLAA